MNTRITLDNLDSRVTFRFADVGDVDALLQLYDALNAESGYQAFLEIDYPKAKKNLLYSLAHDTRPMIVAVVAGEVVGFVSYVTDHLFSARPCLTMIELYVAPAFRRSAIGRGLVAMMTLEAKAIDACMVHASSAAGLRTTPALFNLFRKAGFEMTGYVMRKVL